MSELQNRPILVGTPIEVEAAVNKIRLLLAEMDWVSHPYFIAQRFQTKVNNKMFIYPETYVNEGDKAIRSYHRLTPDNDYSGMFFFMVAKGTEDDEEFMNYNVSIIFSVNLQLIDAQKLEFGLFTQELMSEARKILKKEKWNQTDFSYKFVSETRDLREVYREFSLDVLEQYNRAPLQCFRFELEVKVQDEC